jgi:hypothetical protein
MTHSVKKYQLYKFWDDEYKELDYINELFNDTFLSKKWLEAGYPDKFTGDMCDMRSPQPTWNQRFIDIFAAQGWKDIGTSYYRMNTGTVLPTHGDLYLRYIDLYNLQGQETKIRRAVIFLNDWEPGHYSELQDEPFVNWTAGSTLEWSYDTPHMAANVGLTPRYTLQITGHI